MPPAARPSCQRFGGQRALALGGAGGTVDRDLERGVGERALGARLEGERGFFHGSALLADGRAAASLLQLSQETTARLIDTANQAYFTRVPDLLLAALTRTLSEQGYGNRHCVMLEGHGREAIDTELDVSRTLGWFTSTYPLALADAGAWDALVCATKEQLRAVPDKGVGFNALRLHHPRGSELPQALVVFNYLGVSHQGEAAQPWQPLPLALPKPPWHWPARSLPTRHLVRPIQTICSSVLAYRRR